jgi:hypothetical protein
MYIHTIHIQYIYIYIYIHVDGIPGVKWFGSE